MQHVIYIPFLFALGACVGSFLNVVVWRVPQMQYIQGESRLRSFYRTMNVLSDPPSHCPKCNNLLKWYDNLPVIGWIKLGGKCRFCKAPISARYPVIEALTGLMFVGYYIAFYMLGVGPVLDVTADGRILYSHDMIITRHYVIYGLDMMLLSGLLAASLIDAEHFIIPLEIPWVMAVFGVAVHGMFDTRLLAGNVRVGPLPGALALGATLGLILSSILLHRKIFPAAFAEGSPALEVDRKKEQEAKALAARDSRKSKKSAVEDEPADTDDDREWTPAEVRREIRKEMLFLLPPLFFGLLFVLLAWKVSPIGQWWEIVERERWVSAVLGSILGALAGGFVVWITRILGSIGFGKVAMGMGDVDLMVGVGAVLGTGPVLAAFFVAPFFGMAYALYMLVMRKGRELPYGPYLSMGAAFVILFYGPVASYFAPGLSGVVLMLHDLVHGMGRA